MSKSKFNEFKVKQIECSSSMPTFNVELENSYLRNIEVPHFLDNYSTPAHSYGGSLPLSQYHQLDIVVVKSSYMWRTQRYCKPSSMTAFKQVFNALNNDS